MSNLFECGPHGVAKLGIEQQLFSVVRQVCVIERGVSLPYPELDRIEGWYAEYGTIGLTNVMLDLPLGKPNFAVIRATLIYGDSHSAYSLSIDSAPWPEKNTAVNYETDAIALDILDGFQTYLTMHPHEVCRRDYRRRKSVERAADASGVVRRMAA